MSKKFNAFLAIYAGSIVLWFVFGYIYYRM